MADIDLKHLFVGFAFIEFEDPRDADDAVRDMDGRRVCGVRIRVQHAKSTGGRLVSLPPVVAYLDMATCRAFEFFFLYVQARWRWL